VSATGWLAVRALHVVAMALFVGGQLVLAVAIVPVLRHGDRAGLRAVARRFGWASLAALAVLAATGVAMATHARLWGSPSLHLKLALVVLAVALVVAHMRRPQAHAIEALILVVSLAIVVLGLGLGHGPLPLGR
jgi:uncharacterized membrane protein